MTPEVQSKGRWHPRGAAAVCALLLSACTGSLNGGPDGPGGNGQGGPLAPGAGGNPGSGSPGSPGAGANPGGGPGAVAVPGAVGGINDPLGGTAPGATPGGTMGALAKCVTPAVGHAPLRRLTHQQYDNALRDLLGDSSSPASSFAKDTEEGLFDTMADQNVADLLAEEYLNSAVTAAEGVKDINKLVGCDPAGSTGAACVQDFVKRFGRRAFRRPLTTAEVDGLVSLYNTTKTGSDAATGVRGVLSAVLASPLFIFKPEFGSGAAALPGALKLTPYELSARLSWVLWSSVPDDTLLDAAGAGQLSTPAQVATQARRMLADPRAREGMASFYEQWFGLELLKTTTKDAAVYPSYNDALRDAMAEETHRFVDHVLWEDDGKLSTLLTAPYGFVNGALAKVYGVAAPSDPNTFSKVSFDATKRSGILTQASLLTAFAASNTSSPVKRGKWVRTRMLCQELPEPPANIPALPPPKQGVSTRERFAMHTASPACSGCHKLIDGLGFGLEAYDGIGAMRTMDLGVAVDTSGEITATTDINGTYNGAPELAAILAQSEQVQACAPTQWFRYTFGRHEEAEDACSLAAMQEAFKAADGDLKTLMVALTQTDTFMNYRKPE